MKTRRKPAGCVKTPWGEISPKIKTPPAKQGTAAKAVEQTILIGDRLNCRKRPLPP